MLLNSSGLLTRSKEVNSNLLMVHPMRQRSSFFGGENGVSIPGSLQSFMIVLSLSLRVGLNITWRYTAAVLSGKDNTHQVPVVAGDEATCIVSLLHDLNLFSKIECSTL
jgi:hypothetical protein